MTQSNERMCKFQCEMYSFNFENGMCGCAAVILTERQCLETRLQTFIRSFLVGWGGGGEKNDACAKNKCDGKLSCMFITKRWSVQNALDSTTE